MHKINKLLAVTAAAGVIGLLFASSAQAATRTWNSKVKSGNWSAKSNWGGTAPTASDSVKFTNGTVTATFDMEIAKVVGVAKTGTGTATLASLPSTFKLGAMTQSNGTLIFGWKDAPATDPLSSISIQGGSTLDFGGATQTLEAFPTFTSGKAFTLKNGTMTSPWQQNNVFTLTLGQNAAWTFPTLRTFNYASQTWTETTQTLNVKDGGVLKVTGDAYLGDGMRDSKKAQRLNINISNGGCASFDKNLYLGRQGLATVTVTNGTLSVGATLYGAMRYSPASRTINALSELYVADGAELVADRILYGDSGGENGRFTFNVSGNSKVYTRTLQGVGKETDEADRIKDRITLNGATFIPLSSNDALFKGSSSKKLERNYITIGANGLTIDNERTNTVTIAEELRGSGAVIAKMKGAEFILQNAMKTTGGVSFEDPGFITLDCEQQAFPSGSTVTLKFSQKPVTADNPEKLLIDWSKSGQPDGVTFKLAEDGVSGIVLTAATTGLFVSLKGHEAAAFAEWKGGDDRDANATTNWSFTSESGEVLENGYIGVNTVFIYGGGNPRFNVTNGADAADHLFLITKNVTLPADRDWSGFDTVALADGVAINENGYKLKLGGNLMGTNDNATVSNGGELDFSIPADEQKLLGPMILDGVTNIWKRGAGVLTATNLVLRTMPSLTLTGGTMAFDWSGQALPTNFLASLSVPGSATLNLGGASQEADFPISDSKTFTITNGFLTTGWNAGNTANPTRKFNIAKDAVWTVKGGLTAEQVKYEGNVKGGVLTVKGNSVLGDWYNTRQFKLYVTENGTFNHVNGDLTIGSTGVGLVDLDNSTLNANGRTIKASVKTTTKNKDAYNGDATLILDKKAVLKAKAIVYGDDKGTINNGKTKFTFKATGRSTLYIESLTAAGQTKDEITFSAATIVPMKSGVLIKGATNLTSNVINIGRGGLTIDNQFTNTVTIAETLKDVYEDDANKGTVVFDLNGADLTITEPQLCKNFKFVNPGLVKLTGSATFAAGTTITFDYTDAQFVKRSKIVTWETPQPADLTAVMTERGQTVTGRKLAIYPNGISFKVGFVLTFR